ncbi:MAG: AMP-binding protein [Pseudomonadota bacterium]|nr:AMP-binding protein [Pseudomonadota bacterium]
MSLFGKIHATLKHLPTLLKVKQNVYGYIDKQKSLFWLSSVEQQLQRHPKNNILINQYGSVSAQVVLERSYQVSRWAIQKGLTNGDVIAVNLNNCPLFVPLLLGLGRLGITVALINTTIHDESLLHSLRLSKAKTVIIDEETVKHMNTLKPQDRKAFEVIHASGEYHRSGDFEVALSAYAIDPVESQSFDKKHTALFIYTSGTTGLPKAVKMSQIKCMLGVLATSIAMKAKGMTAGKRLYVCLPLFHGTGLLVGLMPALNVGASVAIDQKFSASLFIEHVVKYQATGFIYIGEICRYLANAPYNHLDQHHKLTFAIGNGLRPDVWPKFQARYGLKHIVEFYAATEGNFILFNLDNKQGSVGWLLERLFHQNGGALIQLKEDNETPDRDEQGFCKRVGVMKPGELIGLIPAKHLNKSQGNFDGYTDEAHTQKKILKNVFVEGDQYYRTGDILMYDHTHHFYFIDRIGDTFRWKGENISTHQVEELLSAHPLVKEIMVYGIQLKGYDGKVGMAALVSNIDDTQGSNIMDIIDHGRLTNEQIPKFVRLTQAIDKTATAKYQRNQWAKQGINPKTVKDVIFVYDHDHHNYIPMDQQLYKSILDMGFRIV